MKDIEVHWPISSKRSKIPYLAHDYPHLAHDFKVSRDGLFAVNGRKSTR